MMSSDTSTIEELGLPTPPPPSYAAHQARDKGAPPLPMGYTKNKTAKGRIFYVNHLTKTTHWDLPVTSPSLTPVVAPSPSETKPKALPYYPAIDTDKESSSSHGSSGYRSSNQSANAYSPGLATSGSSHLPELLTVATAVEEQESSDDDGREYETEDDEEDSADATDDYDPDAEEEDESKNKNKVMALRESVFTMINILLIICVVVILFIIIDRITLASVYTQSTLIAADARAQVSTWLREKIAVVDHHEYVYRTGQYTARDMIIHPKYAETNQTTLPNPMSLRHYEVMTSPFFANDADLYALYNAMSNNQTWKIHSEAAPTMATQLRYAGTVSATNSTPYFERYERHRDVTDPQENFTVTKYKAKRYTPTEQGWFQDASNSTLFNATTNLYAGLWQGPSFQGTGVGAGTDTYGLEPVMTYLKKVLWRDTSKFSVFKLKILTTSINALLQRLDIPGKGDIALVNAAGAIAGYRISDAQVIPDATDPDNAKKATFAKVWSIPHFDVVTLAVLQQPIPQDQRVELGNGVSLFSLDEDKLPGFRIVTFAAGDAPYRSLFDAILALASLLMVLGFVSIVYSMYTVKRRVAEASSATIGRLLGDLLPGPIAGKVVDRSQWPITASYPAVTVFYADIVNFTERAASAYDPTDIVMMLNYLVEEFDRIAGRFKVEKIKTIGDCYMAVTGAPIANANHASSMLKFAFAMLEQLTKYNGTDNHHEPVLMRTGLHSGPVTGGVIGARRFLFDVFGPTVHTAQKVEGHGTPMQVLCTAATKKCAEKEDSGGNAKFEFVGEHSIAIKAVTEEVTCFYVRSSGKRAGPDYFFLEESENNSDDDEGSITGSDNQYRPESDSGPGQSSRRTSQGSLMSSSARSALGGNFSVASTNILSMNQPTKGKPTSMMSQKNIASARIEMKASSLKQHQQVGAATFSEVLIQKAKQSKASIQSMSGDTVQLSWNTSHNVLQPEAKAAMFLLNLRDTMATTMPGLPFAAACCAGRAEVHSVYSISAKQHALCVDAPWLPALDACYELATRHHTIVVDSNTATGAEYSVISQGVDCIRYKARIALRPDGTPSELTRLPASSFFPVRSNLQVWSKFLKSPMEGGYDTLVSGFGARDVSSHDTMKKKSKNARNQLSTTLAFELHKLKAANETDGEEWMYQIRGPEAQQSGPTVALIAAAQGKLTEASNLLAQHLVREAEKEKAAAQKGDTQTKASVPPTELANKFSEFVQRQVEDIRRASDKPSSTKEE